MSGRTDLTKLFETLHGLQSNKLNVAQGAISHTTAMGDSSEADWSSFLNCYLPKRYQASKVMMPIQSPTDLVYKRAA